MAHSGVCPSRVPGGRQRPLRVAVVVALIAGGLLSSSSAAPGQTPPAKVAAAAPRWSVVGSESPPGPPNGDLNGVACATTTTCFAVGVGGDQGALAQQWDGTSWKIVPTATADGSTQLSGVACPSATSCFAVGSVAHETQTSFSVAPLVERWNGTTWSITKLPATGAPIAELNAISCASPTSCIAVGDKSNGDIDTFDVHSLSLRWNGTTWSAVAVPRPAGARAEILFGVACGSPTSCLGAGAFLADGGTNPLVEQWNGSKWSIVPAPLPAGRTGASLSGAACSSATNCFVVGSSFSGPEDDTPLVEQWNGTALSIVPSPGPLGVTASAFAGVACASATNCSAVGGSLTLESGGLVEIDAPLNEHWNGTEWTIVSSPANAPFTFLAGVACASATSCFAVGDSGLTEQWNGSSWSIAPFGQKSSQSVLFSVACPRANRCFAAGEYLAGDGVKVLIEQFDGTGWTIADVPIPAGAPNSALLSISCTSVDDCTAVGLYQQDPSTNPTLIEHWDGKAWSIVPSPSPAGAFATQLTDVSCATAKSCNAIGVSFTATQSATFGEHWNGTAWSIVPVPQPAFAELVTLPGLSCPSPTTCFLVGGYLAVTGTRQLVGRTLIERWDGKQWKTVRSPQPKNAQLAQLGAVSCANATQCLAVGISLSNPTPNQPIDQLGGTLTLRWDGKQWKIAKVDRSLDVAAGVGSLACRSAVSCYGVGQAFTQTGGSTEVVHWNGHAWSRVPSANPPGTRDASLSGVACATATSCQAVGSFRNVLGSFTLGLRGS